MSDDEKEPENKPKDEPDKQPQEAAGAEEAGQNEESGDVPLSRAERRARKHKRKGELRQLHDRDRPSHKGSKGHSGQVFRRKSI
jgi:hypothetical protein